MKEQTYEALKMRELRSYREKNRLCKHCGKPLPRGHQYKNCDSCLEYRQKYRVNKGSGQRKPRRPIVWEIKNKKMLRLFEKWRLPLQDALRRYAREINVTYRTAERHFYENKPANPNNRSKIAALYKKYGLAIK